MHIVNGGDNSETTNMTQETQRSTEKYYQLP